LIPCTKKKKGMKGERKKRNIQTAMKKKYPEIEREGFENK
jgi:hypothetical protein